MIIGLKRMLTSLKNEDQDELDIHLNEAEYDEAMDAIPDVTDEDEAILATEGILSRLGNGFLNILKIYRNLLVDTVYAFQSMISGDWLRFAEKHMARIKHDPPSEEQFSAIACWRSEKATVEKHRHALKEATSLIRKSPAFILSSDTKELPSSILNVIKYLEDCKCVVDVKKPKRSKAARRTKYGRIGTLDSIGYGTNMVQVFSGLETVLKNWNEFYLILSDKGIGARNSEMISKEVSRLMDKADNASSDNERAKINQHLYHIRTRTAAVAAIQKASMDLWKTGILMHALLPIEILGLSVGLGDTLISIIYKKEDHGVASNR